MNVKIVLERLELRPKPPSLHSDEEQDLVGSLMRRDDETQEDVGSFTQDKQTGRGDEGPKSDKSQRGVRTVTAAGDDRSVEVPKLDLEEMELPCRDSGRRSWSEVEINPKKKFGGWAASRLEKLLAIPTHGFQYSIVF